jgi:glycosyltransferase involved in cell wall biosynthesis
MQQGRRENYVKDFASLIYAWRWFQVVKKGIKNTSGAALCNGKEIYDLMKDVKRYETVSSTITEEDFLYREDTCQNDTIRIVTTSFIRPEKGLEYLIDAIPKVRTKKKLMLCCIGAFEKGKGYKELLYSKIKANKLTDRVEFLGYCNPEDFMPFYQSCDIFVLASLSEGTPRCIIESRAAGLPTIATNVGGIPSSVSNGVDGILVSPKNSSAIASAIEALIENNELRRSIIQKGYETAKRLSLPNSVHDIITAFTSINEK